MGRDINFSKSRLTQNQDKYENGTIIGSGIGSFENETVIEYDDY